MATTTDAQTTSRSSTPRRAHRSTVYSVLIGLTGLGVILQGVWAGAFMRRGQGYGGLWLEVHDIGARSTFVLAGLALVASLVWLRHRLALVIGTALLFGLVLLESWIGGEIGAYPWLQSLHFPLGMALLALAVLLPAIHRFGAVPTGR